VLIFLNHQLPQQAKVALGHYGETVDFAAIGIVYDQVNGHPDLFILQARDELIIAPNIPQHFLQLLSHKAINFRFGRTPVGFRYPDSAKYNAVVTEKYFIHNLDISDPQMLEIAGTRKMIHVNQGYTRCNLLALGNSHFLTSDRGIYDTLHTKRLQVLFVDPSGIELPGFRNGFFGGACGVWHETVFISGNLKYHPQGEIIRKFICSAGYSLTELYDGPLFDGGSIVFVD
jgi:hypothetical protein